MPSRVVVVTSCVLVVAACGSSSGTSIDTVGPGTATTPTSAVDSAPGTTLEPSADATSDEAGPAQPLSMKGTLLPDEAFPPPWEPSRRNYDNTTFDYGPFQSSCRGYEIAEQFAGRAEAAMFWWVDGGNANHWVGRESYPGEGEEFVSSVGDAAADCAGVVSWGEGGQMQIEALDLGERVSGFSMVTFPGEDIGYVATMTHGDLISVLWVPLWQNIDGVIPDLRPEGFAAVAQQARRLLLTAGPATADELSTTSLPPLPDVEPGTRPDPGVGTSVPGATKTTTTTTTSTTSTTTTTVPPGGLALLLLTPDDLGPRWRLGGVDPYSSSPSDPDLVEACPAAASIDVADASFEWESDMERDDGVNLGQLIGRVDDVATAAEVAEQFARLVDCDLTEEFGDMVDYSGGAVPIAGASAAGELTFVADGELVATTVLAAVGDLIIVVGVDPGFGGADLSTLEIRDLALQLTAQVVDKALGG